LDFVFPVPEAWAAMETKMIYDVLQNYGNGVYRYK
jgi:hypothetical protein